MIPGVDYALLVDWVIFIVAHGFIFVQMLAFVIYNPIWKKKVSAPRRTIRIDGFITLRTEL
jgi:hypothetical protein